MRDTIVEWVEHVLESLHVICIGHCCADASAQWERRRLFVYGRVSFVFMGGQSLAGRGVSLVSSIPSCRW